MAVMDAGGLTFIRFLGMNFLVAGFVSPELSSDFASKVGWGDFIAAVLALFSMAALSWRWSIAIPVVWLFNIWGTLDLLNAYYMESRSSEIPVSWPQEFTCPRSMSRCCLSATC
jgi:hypothetical protein